jgi:hypothetical protein
MAPEDAAKIGCVGCHDNGPFMNSRWMHKFGPDLSDDSDAPYFNSTPPFDKWPQPRFVKTTDDTCTSCHKIAAAGRKTDSFYYSGMITFQSCANCNAECAKDPNSTECGTCRGWIMRVTGQTAKGGTGSGAWSTHPLGANAAALDDKLALWMPPMGETTRADWTRDYKKEVDHLLQCCEAVGKSAAVPGRKPGEYPLAALKDCSEFVPTVTAVAPPTPVATEVMTDRCKRRVSIPPSYDAKPDAPGRQLLVRDATGFSPWTPPFDVALGPSGHIRWYCGQPNPAKWWKERSRCNDRSTKIRARLGPKRLLEIECLGK